jgi:hypothetical protein
MVDREANVLLELRMAGPVSGEVLAANGEQVIDSLLANPSSGILGPALAVNPLDHAIKLQFDVHAQNEADVFGQVKKAIDIVSHETGLELRVHRTRIEAWSEIPNARFTTAF